MEDHASILIVDDSVLNLMGLKYQLSSIRDIKTLKIDEALNGEEAINLIKKRIELCK